MQDKQQPRQSSRAGSSKPAAAAPATSPNLRCLVGVRALASIGVVVLHSYMLWQFFLDHHTKYELTRSNALIKLASAGMFWVDVLLILSAMLAAHQLLPRLADPSSGAPPCAAVVLAYWRRRAARLLPGYLLANLLVLLALGPAEGTTEQAAAARWINFYWCPGTLWANLLFAQNWLGTRACATHFWTVALQVQFFAVFPLLLWALRPRSPGFHTRLAAALAAAFAGGTAWRLWTASRVDFMELPVADFATDQPSQLSWANMLMASYLPTASRVAQLAGGAALGLLLRSPAALRWVQHRRALLAAAALALQAALAQLLLRRPLLFRPPGGAPWTLRYARLHIALLSCGGPFSTALVCATLLALVLHADPLHAAAARLLAARPWHPPAELSYAQYLLHEQARLWVLLLLPAGVLPRLIRAHPLAGFVMVAAGTLGAGYAAALAMHLPLRRWSRSSSELAPAL